MHVGIVYAATVGFAAGVALQTLVPISLAGLYILAGCAVVAALFYRVRWRSPRTTIAYQLIALALACAVLGVWRMDVAQERLENPELQEAAHQDVALTGTVIREPEVRPSSVHFHLATPDGRILVIADRLEAVSYGDQVTVSGRLDVPEPFAAELGRTFPYDGYLAARGITHILFYPEVSVQGEGAGHPVIAALLTNKAATMERLEALIPEPEVALGEGLLLGVRRAMDDETLTDFRTTGIIHIVVLSGFNVMLVVAFVQYVFGYFLPLRPRIIASMVAIVGYAITVGLTATVTRASIMALLLLTAHYLGRTYEAIRGLFVAGAVMIAFNPYLLVYDIGFQLSFVATLGLILVAPHLETLFATVPTKVGARGYVVATIATQIAVLPLLLYHVGEFSVVSPVVNLLILPMVPVAMLFVFLTGAVSALSSTLAQPFAVGAYLSLKYILEIATWFAGLPFAAFWVSAFPFIVVPIAYALLGYGYWWYTKREKRPAMPQPVTASTAETVPSLAGWTIVDVSDAPPGHSAARSSGVHTPPTPSTEETPAFFR